MEAKRSLSVMSCYHYFFGKKTGWSRRSTTESAQLITFRKTIYTQYVLQLRYGPRSKQPQVQESFHESQFGTQEQTREEIYSLVEMSSVKFWVLQKGRTFNQPTRQDIQRNSASDRSSDFVGEDFSVLTATFLRRDKRWTLSWSPTLMTETIGTPWSVRYCLSSHSHTPICHLKKNEQTAWEQQWDSGSKHRQNRRTVQKCTLQSQRFRILFSTKTHATQQSSHQTKETVHVFPSGNVHIGRPLLWGPRLKVNLTL